MKTLLKDIKSYTKEVILAPLFKMLEAVFELFVPLIMQRIIDVGIGNRDTGYILKMSLVLVGLALIGLVCAATAQYFSAKAATGFSTQLRHKMFRHIQTMSFTQLDHIGASTLITRMTSDINQIQNGVNLTLRLFMRSPFVVFGAMIMAFTVDVKAALIFVVVIPLLSIVVFGIMLRTMPLYKKVQGALDKVTGRTRENLTGVRVIRAFSREDEETEFFREDTEELKNFQLFVGRISAFMNPATYVIVNGAIIVLIYVGAIRVNVGHLTQGMVVALINYMNQILVELIKLANLIIQMTKAAACGNRVEAVLQGGSAAEEAALLKNREDRETEKDSNAGDYVVEFDHLSMHYDGSSENALTDVALRVKRGETIGIIGGTGSGKSTLVHLIPGFYPTEENMLKVDGRDVRAYDVVTLRDKIGIVLQKAVLFKGTIRENLLWGKPDASDEELWEALEKAQAAEVVRGKEGMLDAEVEQEGRNFSGGQRQRIAIARALVKKPEILILDDSASALDFATDAKLRQAVSEMDPNMTIFIISQRAASVMGADQIVVLDDGRVAAVGNHNELLKDCEVYKEIYDTQFN